MTNKFVPIAEFADPQGHPQVQKDSQLSEAIILMAIMAAKGPRLKSVKERGVGGGRDQTELTVVSPQGSHADTTLAMVRDIMHRGLPTRGAHQSLGGQSFHAGSVM